MICDASAVERPRRREEGREGREHGAGACLVRGLPEPGLSPTTSVLTCVLPRLRVVAWPCALVPWLGHIVLDLVRGLPAPVLRRYRRRPGHPPLAMWLCSATRDPFGDAVCLGESVIL